MRSSVLSRGNLIKRLIAFLILPSMLIACAASLSSAPTPPCSDAPIIISFAASPNILIAGTPSVLTWRTANATQVRIAPDLGALALAGSISITPTIPVTYTLTALGCGGTATKHIRIVVNPGGMIGIKAFQGLPNPDNANQVKTWVHAQAAKPLAQIEIVVATASGVESFVCANTAACDAMLGYRNFGFAFTYWGKVTDADATQETPHYNFTVSK